MYKWPQGKVIRTIGALLALIIAVDLGWAARGRLSDVFAGTPGDWHTTAVGAIYALAALTALIGGFIAVGVHHRAVDFLIEVEQEMTRVTWPAGRDLVRSTIFIAAMIVVLAAGILAVDYVNKSILNIIFGVES